MIAEILKKKDSMVVNMLFSPFINLLYCTSYNLQKKTRIVTEQKHL